ncbi:MAG: hypothetical protein L3J70_08795 [Gammaproteobacteria bacterium]|nr:hypothetical protein [Gammaproteobacteria bacterium]
MQIKRLFPCILSASVALGMLSSSNAVALGLGDIEVHSSLNQPLDAEIKLFSLDEGDFKSLSVELASPEIFDRKDLDRLAVLGKLHFEVTHIDGEPYVIVRSDEPIIEPFLDFLVEVNWSRGRLIREYTLLLDPPDLTTEKPAPVSAPATTHAIPVRPKERAEPVNDRLVINDDGSISYGATERHDTLWKIALEMRPDSSVSVFQAMMALLKANPESFYKNNINSLKAGYILRIDDVARFTAINKKQASEEYTIQSQQWQAIKQGKAQISGENTHKLQGEPDSTVIAEAPAARKPIQPARLELAAPDDGALNKAGGSADELSANIERLQNDLELALQSNAATEKENALLQSRLVELENQISELKRLLSIESGVLSNLQNREADVIATTSDNEQIAQTPTVTGEPQQAATPPVTSVAQVDQQKEDAKPESFIGGLLKDPTALGLVAGVGLGLLALGAIVVRRRSRDNESLDDDSYAEFTTPLTEEPETDSRDISANDKGDAATETVTTTEKTVDAEEDMQLDYEIDPIDEADVYIAYRRYPQAEDLLKEAIQIDPDRNELHVKLLEIYAATGEQDAFIVQAELLNESIRPGEDRLWSEVSSMASKVCPGHALFQNGEQAELQQEDEATQMFNFDANALSESSLLLSEEIDLTGDDKLLEGTLVTEDLNPPKKKSLESELESESKDDNSIAFEGGLGEGLAPLVKNSEELAESLSDLEELPHVEGEFSIPEASLADADSGDDWLSKMDEIGTRLDLARAYIDMGDDGGAVEILNDVMEKGDDQQKKDALDLMQQLS